MTKNAPLLRPAASAIAAFLVLSTPGAFAQETTVPMTPPVSVPSTSAPPTVQPPATTAPATAPTAQPAPQPVIRVPLDLPPAPKAAESEAAAPPARARAERTAPQSRPAQAAPPRAPAASVAPIAAAAAPIEEAVPITSAIAEPMQPTVEAAPAVVEKAGPATGDSFPWEIVGGAAALLIAGGAGLAFARRRKATNEVWEFEETSNADWVPTTEPAAEPAFTRTETVAAPEPQPMQAATTPAFTAVPAGSMGRHEAMAMAGPTPENPFATLSKRLARARFLDRQERASYEAALATSEPQAEQVPVRKPVSAWEIAQRQTIPAPAEQEVRRLEPGHARKEFKPGWTRN